MSIEEMYNEGGLADCYSPPHLLAFGRKRC